MQSDNLYLAFSGGTSFYRGDVGSIILVTRKNGRFAAERLLSIPGLSYMDTPEQSTLLVNGVGQPKEKLVAAKYQHFGSGEGFHYLEIDAAPLYGPPLTKFNRHLVMVRGKYVVLLDDLAASSPANFESRFQTALEVTTGSDGATLRGTGNILHLRSAGFTPPTYGQGAGGDDLHYVSLSVTGREATLLTVLYPTFITGAAPVVSVADGTVTIAAEGETDTLTFASTNGDWALISVNGLDATTIPDGSERSIIPLRESRDDAAEVPSWLLETVR